MLKIRTGGVAAVVLAAVTCAHAQDVFQVEPTAELGVQDTSVPAGVLGSGLAIDGDWAVATTTGIEGGVCFFHKEESGWQLRDFFEFSVSLPGLPSYYATRTGCAIQGEWAFVGARFGSANGLVRAFRFIDGQWAEFQSIDPPVVGGPFGSGFGNSLDFDGITLLVGAFQQPSGQAGGAHFYVFDGTAWTLQQSVTSVAPIGGGYFGHSVAIRGDVAAIGSNDNYNARGRVDVFRRKGDTWIGETQLLPPDGSQDDGFGQQLAIDGDVLVVPQKSGVVRDRGDVGQVWIYDFSSLAWPAPVFRVESPVSTPDQFGIRIDVHDGWLAVATSPSDLGRPPILSEYRLNRTSVDRVAELRIPLSSWAENMPQLLDLTFDSGALLASTTGTGGGVVSIFDRDCSGDGIVDYGQILDGTYADNDGNGVPDCCEGTTPCPGDLNLDDRVDSADLGLLIAAWNTDGSIVAGSDINEDGIVNAADLGLQIGNWGDCGCN